jgi:hypothetical protein
MKNIHLITTSQPSRLLCNHTLKSFCFQKEENGMFVNDGKVSGASFWSIEKAKNNGFNPQHIYITSDEEIKGCDWYLVIGGIGLEVNTCHKSNGDTPINNWLKKIILTTDQDLIADGVQAIDDEFLEWFVKNPSCEEVEVIPLRKSSGHYDDKDVWHWDFLAYKITIPQEEHSKQIKCYCGHTSYCDCSPLDEPRKETLEEFALKNSKYTNHSNINHSKEEAIILGAKWQQEQDKNKYSEEDMFEFSQWVSSEDWVYLPSKGYWVNEEQEELEQKLNSKEILNMWFEQYKKK